MSALVQVGLTNAVLATMLAVLAAAVGKLCRRPALAHALWLLVLVKLVTPPLVVIPIVLPVQPDEPASADDGIEQLSPQDAAQEKQRTQDDLVPQAQWAIGPPRLPEFDDAVASPLPGQQPQDAIPLESAAPLVPAVPNLTNQTWRIANFPWRDVVGATWLGGSVVWFSVALVRIRRFQRLLSAGQAGPAALQRTASALAVRLGLRDCPGVWTVPGVLSPLLWAVAGYPKLLLPAKLLSRLDPLQCQTLLAHELAHYRRRDHWVRCLEFAALGIYWWLPVAWWARRELREAEEECCDAWVLWTLPDAAKAYASALVETLDFLSGSQPALPPVASGLGQLDSLRRRLTMIMRGTVPHKLGGVGVLAVLGLGALLIPLWPTWAQQDNVVRSDALDQPRAASEPAQDIQKAKAELERATAELRQLQAQLEKIRAALSDKNAANPLQEFTKQWHVYVGPGGEPPKVVVVPSYYEAAPSIEKRLSDMEKKLDRVLKEVQEMRKAMGGGSRQLESGQPLISPRLEASQPFFREDQLNGTKVIIEELLKASPKKDNPK